jgi:hypothetical protein
LYGTPDEQEIIKEGMKMSDYGVGKPTEW